MTNFEEKALTFAEKAEDLFNKRRFTNERDKDFLLKLAQVYSNLSVAEQLSKLK